MDVRILGTLAVSSEGQDVTPTGRVQRLVFVRLLLGHNQPVPVDQLTEDVFEDGPSPQNPSSTIQVHVSRLRKKLSSTHPAGQRIVRSPAGYRLHLNPDELDVWQFERLALASAQALQSGEVDRVCALLTEGLAIWRGSALCDFAFASYTQSEIRRLEELRLGATEDLFEARLARGEHHHLLSEIQLVAELHPLRERLWGQLMRAMYFDGRQAEALRAYERVRRALAEEVGIVPSPTMRALEHAVLTHDPRLRPLSPPSHISLPPSSTSPQRDAGPGVAAPTLGPLTRFVGRDGARSQLVELLSANRLVTLSGMAGIGKSRLAHEVMCGAGDVFGEVTVVDIASVQGPEQLLATVAAAAGLQQSGGAAPTDVVVAAAIGERSAFLVLDNCEHLAAECADLIWTLLSRCPGLRVVVTSQRLLGVPGEAAWAVPPLSLPPGGDVDLDVVSAAEALQLFCDRAQLVQPSFRLSRSNAATVSVICHRLDGLPLAIELAAAAVAVLSVDEIADLLDDRFNLLTGGSQFVAGRHRSLLAAVDSSYALLSPLEQMLLRRMSVFVGGATLGAVEEVCQDRELRASGVFDLLVGLVAKSLVVADTTKRQARYRLLETIRFFASDRLFAAGEHASVLRSHARWCVGLAERAEPELLGSENRLWTDRLHADLGNIQAALRWTVSERQGDLSLRLASAMALFWARWHCLQGIEGLQHSLSVGGDCAAALRAKALWALGLLRLRVGDHPQAVQAASESVALASECGDGRIHARALVVMGTARGGDNVGFREIDQGIRLAREIGDDWCLARGLAAVGWAHVRRGDPHSARRPLEEAHGVIRRRQNQSELVPILLGLAYVGLYQGDLRVADMAQSEALQLAMSLADEPAVTTAQLMKAQIALARGNGDEARMLLDQHLAVVHQRAPRSMDMVECLCVMAREALDAVDVERARKGFVAAQELLESTGASSSYVLVGLARVELHDHNTKAAAALLDRAGVAARWKSDAIGLAEVAYHRGELARLSGATDQAVAHHRRALQVRVSVDNMAAVAPSLEALASLATEEGQLDRAVQLMAAASRLRTDRGPARAEADRYDSQLEQLRRGVPEERFRAWWNDGLAMSLDSVVRLALVGSVLRAPGSSF